MDEVTDPIFKKAASLPTHQDLHGCETARSAGSESRSSEWLGALKRHIADMKEREQEHRRKSDEERTKYEIILDERMELQNFIYKTERT